MGKGKHIQISGKKKRLGTRKIKTETRGNKRKGGVPAHRWSSRNEKGGGGGGRESGVGQVGSEKKKKKTGVGTRWFF